MNEINEFISLAFSYCVQTPRLRAETSAGTAYTGDWDAEVASKKLMHNKQDLEWVPVPKINQFILKKKLVQYKRSNRTAVRFIPVQSWFVSLVTPG